MRRLHERRNLRMEIKRFRHISRSAARLLFHPSLRESILRRLISLVIQWRTHVTRINIGYGYRITLHTLRDYTSFYTWKYRRLNRPRMNTLHVSLNYFSYFLSICIDIVGPSIYFDINYTCN